MGSWVVEMQARLNNFGNGRSQEEQLGRMKTSIYKVPPFISNNNKKAYQPRVVSFGPYHHGEPHLALMETHKECALLRCIHQSKRPLQEVFDFIVELAEELKDSYDFLDSTWRDNTERFVQLMILDGCFMLELLQMGTNSNEDPVFNRHGNFSVKPFFKADMLLLENQLPMLLLLKLRCILLNAEPDIEALNKDILWLLRYDIYPKMGKCLHVLDLFRKSLLQFPDGGHTHTYFTLPWASGFRPATELHEAGVRFMESKSNSLWDITFEGGVLKLPNIKVDQYTESLFLNLIAFERCHIPASSDITSFITFMDRIIDDSRDIKLLSSKGIICNAIGSDKEAADLFNTMSRDLVMEMNDNLLMVYNDLINYCNTPWPKWRANLTQTYFRSPWAIISVIAAFLLFSLTIVQTIFAILK